MRRTLAGALVFAATAVALAFLLFPIVAIFAASRRGGSSRSSRARS